MIWRDNIQFIYKRKHKKLKIACILDEFTYRCFEPECDLLQITPENWLKEMEQFEPDFLFVESAWGGGNNKWGGKLITAYDEIGEIARYCSIKALPIVFWNKEDPFGYSAFIDMARLADVVLTTDGGCVEAYKKDLGHTNVYFMHFAAQPKMFCGHEEVERQDKFCFAGAYYRQFPERIRAFDQMFSVLNKYKGVDIYDRFYGNKKREFPKKYQNNVIGTLPFDEIHKAYCGYRYNINVNSIVHSETMFARRVFELMATKTIVVSNYSKGLSNYFGDLTICTDDTVEMIDRLREIDQSEQSYQDFVEKCYNRVMKQELYQHRLEQICNILYVR